MKPDADDWTRGTARIGAAAVLLALCLGALALGRLEGRSRPPGVVSAVEPRLIDVNTASPAQLDMLPGIGPKRAQAIIDEREHAGPFKTLDDLQRVHGIGPRTVEGLRELAVANDPDAQR